MKRKEVGFVAVCLGLIFAGMNSHAVAVVDFSDLTLSPESYANETGGFTSYGVGFSNAYGVSYGYPWWGGFAYSNMTDTTTPGYANQYSAITGTDASGVAGGNYAVAYLADTTIPTISLSGMDPLSITLSNTTYTYLTIRDGDSFSAAFASGDWFKVTITGYTGANVSTGAVDYYLADYRSANSADWYIVNTWQTVDLSALGSGTSYLTLTFDSSDVGAWGINTPTYVAVGSLAVVPEPAAIALLVLAGGFAIWKRCSRAPKA